MFYMGAFSCLNPALLRKIPLKEECAIEQDKKKLYQEQAAQKQFEWLARSTPAALCSDQYEKDGVPEGIALPPHERDCGRAHPMRGTNSEDLTEWCIKHES